MNNVFGDLSNKVVVITGGAGILGSQCAQSFLGMGSSVVLLDQDAAALNNAENVLSKQYPKTRILTVVCDVTSEESVNASFDLILKQYSRVDVLVGNAACRPANIKEFFKPTVEYDLGVWNEVMSVNVNGIFLTSKAFANRIKSGGSIVLISSIYGSMAPDGRIYEGSEFKGAPISSPMVYAASKAAIVGMTTYLSVEWASKKIRVNAVSPGGIESGQNSRFVQKYSERVPMRRMAESSEVANAILFLASDASSYMTGQNLFVDGGLSAW